MDDSHVSKPQSSDNKTVLPDVVHSQLIPTVEGAAIAGVLPSEINSGQHAGDTGRHTEISETESISEEIPSNIECSVSDNATSLHASNNLLYIIDDVNKTSPTPSSDNHSAHEPSKQSSSWLEGNPTSEIQHISKESPVNLLLSDQSKESQIEQKPEQESPRSDDFVDSLDDEPQQSEKDNSIESTSHSASDKNETPEKESSGSEEMIKLDIRGKGVPKFPLQMEKIIYGPPPDGSTVIDTDVVNLPLFQQLLSPFLVGVREINELSDFELPKEQTLVKSGENSPDKHSISSDKIQSDLLVEEVTVDQEVKEKELEKDLEDMSIPTQPKSLLREDSFSTLTTDYKTICEEYHAKLEHMEAAITQRDELIEELTISLQRSVGECDQLRSDRDHLASELQNLQHVVGEQSEHSHSEHNTVKAQLSDYMKYQNLIKDDSTKFYSALMSGGSSVQSSNGEKDMDHEEITVNYSKSDLKSSGSSDFQTGFEEKLNVIINKFDEYIEENLRNKLRESIIQVLCDEIGKIRIDTDTEVRELEAQLQQDKSTFLNETRRLRELLASVKAGDADIDLLREELNIKHEKEMENLRTYFEKKCTDMERSYSEEVWRGRGCASPGAARSPPRAARSPDGGVARRRTRSADLPSLMLESTQLEETLKQLSRKYEQQIDEMRVEQVAYVSDVQARHAELIASLEEQITQLKAHILTTENTEAKVSVYQQDIDLELEKRVLAARQDLVLQLQEQIQVLLADPDAELSSWPLELVALRDKIHGEAARAHQERESSSLRDELTAGEADKWKHRRNVSFDQNRQIEEVTKERDGLKRVAASLQRVVGQLVAYCAACEDELNRNVLDQLLARLLPQDTLLEESRPSSPVELNSSAVSKHVHFAPDLRCALGSLGALGSLDPAAAAGDLSLDIKRELDLSLRRLRLEAHELLQLSARTHHKSLQDSNIEDENELQIEELVEDLASNKIRSCESCELHRRNMEESMAECLQRENLLRSDLEAAMVKIAQLMTNGDGLLSNDLIVEGYGTGQVRPAARARTLDPDPDSAPDPAHCDLDLDRLQRERDDLQQQLEAANRQLRSTRQFVEEQAAEREAERDEFAKRLSELREENSRLGTRLQTNARILNEVEQLEAQTREMNQIISELEIKKAAADEELKSTAEEIPILRDIIANLEAQVEQKTAHEAEVLQQLEEMKKTIEDRDRKMRDVLGELDSMRTEKLEQSDVVCARCSQEEQRSNDLLEKVKEQARRLEERIHRSTQRLERVHEECSASCSEPSEDVSLRDHRNLPQEVTSPVHGPPPELPELPELCGVWVALAGRARAEGAALKRVRDLEMQRARLKDVAQEVRAERDVLQARMAEQALQVSSLAARLDRQRSGAEAQERQRASQLSVLLHDARAEVDRLKDELESKDKHLTRLKQIVDERDKTNEEKRVYGNSCNPKDKVIILERELSSAQSRIAQLESLVNSLEEDKEQLQGRLKEQHRVLAEKEDQLHELMALNIDDENQKYEIEALEGAKTSARTLSDIVSISEFDEQDQQMRRAELKGNNLSLSGAPYPTDDKTQLNKTLPPDVQKPNLSSLNIDFVDHLDAASITPRANSLPIHLTSTQNKELLLQYKRNMNETTMFSIIKEFGDSVKHSTQNIIDNCSTYPNRNVSEGKSVSVDPKRINFDLEPSNDNKTNEEFTYLRELGITLDVKQENFPDILTQLKYEIKKTREELENCKSELKNAEEQLCEFPALKEEVEQLKTLLENTMATMQQDKQFYENQLENFTSNKNHLEQRLNELSQEVNEKTKDLHILKEDILRRENMILELAKEKRNLTNKMTELDIKIDELKSRNLLLEKYENENCEMKDKLSELQKLEQLVSEKNQQIDSLNQHLDRLDNLQRCLDEKTEEFDNLKDAFEEKSNYIFQLQDTIEALNKDIASANEENNKLNINNKDLKLKLTKLEKEQENACLKLANSESDLLRLSSLNNELTSKIDELKLLTNNLKDKETEIEILNEDVKSYHDEIASLKEQLKMVSRSPSPRNKNGEEKRSLERQANNDQKQLVKIRKQISLLQHELDFNKKELNDKAFELAKARLDVTELKSNLSIVAKQCTDKDLAYNQLRVQAEGLRMEIEALTTEKQNMADQLDTVLNRLREESNISEVRAKLQEKSERCRELEMEVQDLKEFVDRACSPRSTAVGVVARRGDAEDGRERGGSRSPTAELERAVRDQLHYSHRLDEDIMEQILSASSDEREEIPRLALDTSKSSSSIHSSSSDRMNRLKAENEKLQMQVDNLEARLKDKDALITELNRIRDKLVMDWQAAKLRFEAERDNAGRLQLLLDTHKDTAETLQNQDSNMIQILKKRLESGMQTELRLQEEARQLRARLALLDQRPGDVVTDRCVHVESESSARLRSEAAAAAERARCQDAAAQLERERLRHERDVRALAQRNADLVQRLAHLNREKQEMCRELAAARELAGELRARTRPAAPPAPPALRHALTEIEGHKSELAREIATLKKCISETNSPELAALREDKRQLIDRVDRLEREREREKADTRATDKEHATEIEGHKSELAREIATLKKCISETNSPELAALREDKRQLIDRVDRLEREREREKADTRATDKEHAIRYLQGRCLRLESCRKALVWQKRYLQRALAGYHHLEQTLAPKKQQQQQLTPIARFKRAALAALAAARLRFLVRRRARLRAAAAAALLPRAPPPATLGSEGSPGTPQRAPPARAPRPLTHADRALADYIGVSPFRPSPQRDPFILSTPRGDVAAGYLHKLNLVSRCLDRAMDAARDTPE